MKRTATATTVLVLAVAAVMALIIGVAAFVLTRSSGGSIADPDRPGVDLADPAVSAADAFAAALSTGDFTGLRSTTSTDTAETMADQVAFVTGGLTAAGASGPVVKVAGVTHNTGEDSDTANASATVVWTFPGAREWTYEVGWTLVNQLEEKGGPREWLNQFEPGMVLPADRVGNIVRVVRVPAQRGRILDVSGRSLSGGGGTVTVGIRPGRATDLEVTARTVAALTGVDTEGLVARVLAARPDDFVEVIVMERAAYDQIRNEIRPIPGTVFTEQAAESDLPPNYAKGLLGAVGPATAEIAAASNGELIEGESSGLSGVQQARNEVLAGQVGLRIESVEETVPVAGQPGAAAPRPPKVHREFAAAPGGDVVVTLDSAVQAAADATLAGSALPTALVAVRVSTGDVIAVANGPASSAAYNRAFINRYPPGSTFKVVSALAYMEHGLNADDTVSCPATIVAGKRFKNAGEFALGDVSFRRAFARSCNTTIVGRSSSITSQQLADTAALLGFRDLDAELGMDVFGHTMPVTDDETEHAADTIGQGKVEANVLSVALMSASVANGTSLSPRLFIEAAAASTSTSAAPGGSSTSSSSSSTSNAATSSSTMPAPRPVLAVGPIAQLREMMREVVTDGTGSALANVAGGPVHAKTGTAEYGTADPPEAHAWITGYQGDIAFAVVVEGGGGGGTVAGPVAADFLNRLAGG